MKESIKLIEEQIALKLANQYWKTRSSRKGMDGGNNIRKI